MNYLEYQEYQDYLCHHGVKGQKWGVRRYQNADGSLTNAGKKRLAKDLKKDYKKNYSSAQPYRTSNIYDNKLRNEIDKVITSEDKRRIKSAKDKWYEKRQEANKADLALSKLAKKYGKEMYNDEMTKNGDLYDTPRSRAKLEEAYVYDYGYDKARKERPDLDKVSKSADQAWDDYMEECRKVSDKLLGNYGNTKLYTSKYINLTVRDTVGSIVNSMDSQGWTIKK